ncbi:MAG: hypothetical protein ABIH82_01845 [Candidatus Woesearchaeota archaeon]
MLDEKRVKEAEYNVRRYLEEGLLKKQTNNTAKEMYIENSENSLMTAQKLISLESENYHPYLWVMVTSYYSMYYIANAVINGIGYKVGEQISHKVTNDALIVFVRNKLKKQLLEEYEHIKEEAIELISSKADSLIKNIEIERIKRAQFQYKMDEKLKKGKALTSLERAKEFVFEMKKLIK